MTLLVLQAAALAVVATQGSIFDPLREMGPKTGSGLAWWLLQKWRELLSCALCFGVWTGSFGALLEGSVLHLPRLLAVWTVLTVGAMSGCLAMLFVFVIDYLG